MTVISVICFLLDIHCGPKMPPYYFLNNLVKNELIFYITNFWCM